MASKSTAGGMKFVKLALILFAPAILLIILSSRSCNHRFKTLDDYGKVPEFQFETLDGQVKTNDDLKGKIILFVNIQENCLDSCSIDLFSFEKSLYQEMKSHKKSYKDVEIVSFVQDPHRSPTTDLTIANDFLTDKIHRYDPTKWILAKGDASKLYAIQSNGKNLLIESEKEKGANAYQSLMLLVDKEGHLRMVLDGKEEGMIRKMKESLALLLKEYKTSDAKEH